jgi:hypothetical protein
MREAMSASTDVEGVVDRGPGRPKTRRTQRAASARGG